MFRLANPIKRQCPNSTLGGAGLNFDFQQIPGHRSVVLEALHPGQTQAHHFALNPQVPVHVKVGQRQTVAIGLQVTERQPYVLAQRQGFQRR